MNLENFGFAEAIALIAVVVAFYYGWQNSKLTKRLLEKEQVEAMERSRADLGANLVKIGKGYRLKVFNRGKAPARNVRIEWDEGENDLLIRSEVQSKFPLEHLEPQQGVDLIAAVRLGSKSKHPFTLTWDDDSKANNQKVIYATT